VHSGSSVRNGTGDVHPDFARTCEHFHHEQDSQRRAHRNAAGCRQIHAADIRPLLPRDPRRLAENPQVAVTLREGNVSSQIKASVAIEDAGEPHEKTAEWVKDTGEGLSVCPRTRWVQAVWSAATTTAATTTATSVKSASMVP